MPYDPKELAERYRIIREGRRVYSLEEIETLPATDTIAGYRNRRIDVGVWLGEHILVAESYLGARLPLGSSVHHRNGVRNDNRIENLEVWARHHPAGQRICCPRCGWPELEIEQI